MVSAQRLFSAALKAALLRRRLFSTPSARMSALRARAGHALIGSAAALLSLRENRTTAPPGLPGATTW